MRDLYAAKLSRLSDEILEMGNLCGQAILKTCQLLACAEIRENASKDIEKIEKEIDDKEHNIEALCMQLLLKQQPVGADLRKISAALKMVTDMERIGDEEVKENNLAVWLTPAVNIHRNPLCGRNFEYYSEDPLIAGKMGAAMVNGIQSQHIGASVKHFAANNKETNRKHSDSRVSERALREIYLKAFEIIVKEAQPWTIMSSYNAINGHRASENRELLEDILRGEWGFKGMVTTDWWTRGEHYKEIKAGNDVKMANGFPERVKKAMEMGQLGREELEHCARRVLELILKID